MGGNSTYYKIGLVLNTVSLGFGVKKCIIFSHQITEIEKMSCQCSTSGDILTHIKPSHPTNGFIGVS
jgi:hypothetical protein